MVSLIREQDNSVLSKDGFVKNAVFYKDLFAFYDAYTKLMKTDTADLPGYVYHKNRYKGLSITQQGVYGQFFC